MENMKYTYKKFEMSIGLNDKDTRKQIISTENAKQIIIQELDKKNLDFSLIQTYGGYTHEDGEKVKESGFLLIIIEKDTKKNIEKIKALRDKLLKILNQENIFINVYEFFSL